MQLDEDLRRRFGALADQIRADVARELAVVTDELTTLVDGERAAAAAQASADASTAAEQQAAERLAEAIVTAEARGRHEGLEQGRDEGLAQGRHNGREEARASARANELAANQRLVDAVRTIDDARSLSEILDALVSCAAREAARVAMLLVRGGELEGWRFLGFGTVLDSGKKLRLSVADAGLIGDAIRTRLTISANTGPSAAPSFAELPDGREMIAVPISLSGQVVAVLYADQGPPPADVTRGAEEPSVHWPTALEIMARQAMRCLEALTAFRAAQLLAERAAAPAPAVGATPGGSVTAGAQAGHKPEDEDEAARRYARLLISEIKLYHEPAVSAGRRERDLTTRLGGEIAHARALYEQRVPAHVRRARDHFYDELVRTLADGDRSLVGGPAPRV